MNRMQLFAVDPPPLERESGLNKQKTCSTFATEVRSLPHVFATSRLEGAK
jgi:hypothetical protein